MALRHRPAFRPSRSAARNTGRRRDRGRRGCLRARIGVDILAEMQERGVARRSRLRTAWRSRSPWVRVLHADRQAARIPADVGAGGREFRRLSRSREGAHLCAHVRWNQTVYDPHNNMLRATTEAHVGGPWGCGFRSYVAPFDEAYNAAMNRPPAGAEHPDHSQAGSAPGARSRRRRRLLLPGGADRLHRRKLVEAVTGN